MSEFSDDCFAHGGALLSIDEALARFRTRVAPVAETETLALFAADGRVLAEPVVAAVAIPPFTNAAVDGYALRHADLALATADGLRVVDRVQAGEAPGRAVGPGEAVRLFTGAPLPAGADTVCMQEDVVVDGDRIRLSSHLRPGANCRPVGEERQLGAIVLPAGRRLRPQDLALAAAAGAGHVVARRRLRVAVFSTGDELVEPGRPLAAARLYDANRVMILAWAARLGAQVDDLGILPDDPEVLAAALAAAVDHDLIVTSGGVSAGDADHVKAAVARVGRIDFWRFAIKPGKPLALGTIGTAAFVGLPGNPVAVFVTLTRIARGLFAARAGETWAPPIPLPVVADFTMSRKPGRTEFLRVSLTGDGEGLPIARRYAVDGAGIVSSLTETDGLVELGPDLTAVAPGDRLAFVPFAALLG
ncbi:gephyrin-like molybdotransferase Glp [Methyloraptor flagellatus]|uniref:Molybdopterin molybdenumtransferase n=1 Tax=Methyloraptor flagellatus TaxID=3162530 RepID=A0AAU7X784_9HYPH